MSRPPIIGTVRLTSYQRERIDREERYVKLFFIALGFGCAVALLVLFG